MKKRAFGKLYKELFYIPKHEKLPDKVFRCRMLVSLFTILACTVVMATSTFALFYMDVSTANSTIAGAYYSVTVGNTENETYICPLVYEDKHTFEIKADGTATTGYCKIQVGEQIYYTNQIPQGASLTLTVQAAKDTVITFTPQWGTVNVDTCGNEIIHSATPYAVYEVEPTAELANIAVHYGVSEVDILTYNDIMGIALLDVSTDNSTVELAEGTELKIPGVSENEVPYAVPYATYIVEPTATLEDIAFYYNVSAEDILAFNGIENIALDMSVKIPNVAEDMVAYSVPYTTYYVEPTATLSNIAEYYGVTAEDILLYNDIMEIAVSTILKIPGVSHDIAPYVAPVSEQTEGESFSENESASSDNDVTDDSFIEEQPTGDKLSADDVSSIENSNTEELDKDSTEMVEKTETTESSEKTATEPTEESSEEATTEPTEESSEETTTEPTEEASEEVVTEPTEEIQETDATAE